MVVPVVGLALAVATWFVWTAGKSQPVIESTAETTPEITATAPPATEQPQPEAASPRLDRRWLPARASGPVFADVETGGRAANSIARFNSLSRCGSPASGESWTC